MFSSSVKLKFAFVSELLEFPKAKRTQKQFQNLQKRLPKRSQTFENLAIRPEFGYISIMIRLVEQLLFVGRNF